MKKRLKTFFFFLRKSCAVTKTRRCDEEVFIIGKGKTEADAPHPTIWAEVK